MADSHPLWEARALQRWPSQLLSSIHGHPSKYKRAKEEVPALPLLMHILSSHPNTPPDHFGPLAQKISFHRRY